MNPVYSPVQPGAPYGNPKNMAYTGRTGLVAFPGCLCVVVVNPLMRELDGNVTQRKNPSAKPVR